MAYCFLMGGRYIKASLRREVLDRDDYRCQNCLKRYEDVRMLNIDHINPYVLGGSSDDLDSLQVLCRRCNARKGAKQGWESLNGKEQRKKPLFPSRPLPKGRKLMSQLYRKPRRGMA